MLLALLVINCTNSIRKAGAIIKSNIEIASDMQAAIYESINSGDKNRLEQIISEGNIEINSTFSQLDYSTMLHLAVLYSKVEIIEFLLSIGAMPDIVDGKGNPPIFYTALSGDYLLLNNLIQRSDLWQFTASTRNDSGDRLVHIAARNDIPEIIEVLNDNLINVNIVNLRNDNGNTPLQEAIKSGSISSIRLLIDLGARYDVTDEQENNILHLAAESGLDSLIDIEDEDTKEVSRTYQDMVFLEAILQKKNIDYIAQDSKAAKIMNQYSNFLQNVELDNELLQPEIKFYTFLFGLIINLSSSQSPLEEVFNLLSAENIGGYSPLQLAVMNENNSFILAISNFIKRYSIYSANEREGILEQTSECVRRIVNRPIDILVRGRRNRLSALDIAIRKGDSGIVKSLLDLSPRVLDFGDVDQRIAISLEVMLRNDNINSNDRLRIQRLIGAAQSAESSRVSRGQSVRLRLGRPPQQT